MTNTKEFNATPMPSHLNTHLEALVAMLQRFYDGHVDDFDDRGILRCVQVAMVHVDRFSDFYSETSPRLTSAVVAAIDITTVPSIEQLIFLRDARRRVRAAAQQAILKVRG